MITNLPNILTIVRILLLPFFAAALVYGYYPHALIIFLAASVTDFFDGLIARVRKEITLFGSILDPVADKFFLITSFTVMSIYGWIPLWLTITVISRDIIVVTGWLILSFVSQSPRVETSLIGKIACTLQFVVIGLVLLSINLREKFQIPMGFLVAVALITAVSGVFYIYRGLKAVDVQNV